MRRMRIGFVVDYSLFNMNVSVIFAPIATAKPHGLYISVPSRERSPRDNIFRIRWGHQVHKM